MLHEKKILIEKLSNAVKNGEESDRRVLLESMSVTTFLNYFVI